MSQINSYIKSNKPGLYTGSNKSGLGLVRNIAKLRVLRASSWTSLHLNH